jgi:hypothetical protein
MFNPNNPQQQFQKQQKDFTKQQAADRQKWLEQAAYADQQARHAAGSYAPGSYDASPPTARASRGCATSARMLLTLFVGGPIFLALCGLIGYVIGFAGQGQQTAYIFAAIGGIIGVFITGAAVIAVSNR